MKAVVILPCLNEESTVGEVISGLRKEGKDLGLELVILGIDDASSDNSLEKLSGSDRVVAIKKRVHLAEIIRIGLKEAENYRPDILIHIDSDGQHDPADLNRLLEPIKNNMADFVIGSRFINKNNMDFNKKLGNKIFTFIVDLITGLRLTDAQSGFRIIRYNCIRKIKLSAEFTYTQEEIIAASRIGCRIKEVPIKVKKRMHGRSKLIKNNFLYGWHVLKDLARIIMQKKDD